MARAGSRAVVAAHRLADRHPPRAVITRGAVTRHVPEHTATVGVRALLSEGRRQQATAFHRHTLPGVKPSFQGLDLWFFISKSAVLPREIDTTGPHVATVSATMTQHGGSGPGWVEGGAHLACRCRRRWARRLCAR